MISLVPPARVASTLRLMGRPPTTRIDVAVAREVAQRQGVQAIVDSGVTGVPGGYIVTMRLVTADSGAEALRAFSAGGRAGTYAGDMQQAITLERRAVAIDSTFGSARSSLAIALENLGMSQASIDSALERAFQLRGRLTERERWSVEANYYDQGPHRDRLRAIESYSEDARLSLRPGLPMTNMGEVLREMRQFARAESLDVRSLALDTINVVAAVDVVQLELDRGGVDSAAAMYAIAHRRRPGSPIVATQAPLIAYARGDFAGARRLADSLGGTSSEYLRSAGLEDGAALAVVQGQLARASHLYAESQGDGPTSLADSLTLITASAWFRNSDANAVNRMNAALARYPLAPMALADRPYFAVATAWARLGKPDRAEAAIAAYRLAVTDTARLRLQAAGLHTALGEIALAEHHADRAVAEFRQGDVADDGRPATECAPCLPLALARAFDAGGAADSAIAEYELFLATPYYNRLLETDPLGLALAQERLGELYEVRGDAARAAAHDERFIALWANADADLEPRVAEARRRLAGLGVREGKR